MREFGSQYASEAGTIWGRVSGTSGTSRPDFYADSHTLDRMSDRQTGHFHRTNGTRPQDGLKAKYGGVLPSFFMLVLGRCRTPEKRFGGRVFSQVIRVSGQKGRVTSQKSELQTKSQSYSGADPQNSEPNRPKKEPESGDLGASTENPP